MTNKFNSLDDSQLNISGGQIDKKKLLKKVGIIAVSTVGTLAAVGTVLGVLAKFGKLPGKLQNMYNESSIIPGKLKPATNINLD